MVKHVASNVVQKDEKLWDLFEEQGTAFGGTAPPLYMDLVVGSPFLAPVLLAQHTMVAIPDTASEIHLPSAPFSSSRCLFVLLLAVNNS